MIANMQVQSCKEIANSVFATDWFVENDKSLIEALIEWKRSSASQIAKEAGLTPSTLTRPLNYPVKHRLSTPTLVKLKETFPDFPGFALSADQPVDDPDRDYLPIEVLPTYAGAGGGGTGDADREIALVPRALIEDVLRGSASDFLLINIRGDSMEPNFRHGDQLLVDCRDVSPAQPGPFALWDGEWGEYVVKNVERVGNGDVRIFSSNEKYSPSIVQSEHTRIIGRPVWFGRRL